MPLLHEKSGDVLTKWMAIRKRIFEPALSFNISDDEIFAYINSYIPLEYLPDDPLNCHLFYEWNTHLPEEYLIREDSLGSFFSLEARYPLLTNSFRHYAQAISPYEKISQEKPSKYIMREAYKNILPDYIIDKRKTGFMTPLQQWAKPNSLFTSFIAQTLADEYNPETNPLFNLDLLRNMTYNDNSRITRSILNVSSYRLWAKEFHVVL